MILRGAAAAVPLAALHARCFPPGERWDAAAMDALLRMPGCAAVLAGADAGADGMALFRVAADEAELLTLAVRPDARRRGVARAVLAAAAAEAAALGAVRMLLEVADNNGAALALYRGAGFAPVGRRRGYYPDGGDAVVMAARLPLVPGELGPEN